MLYVEYTFLQLKQVSQNTFPHFFMMHSDIVYTHILLFKTF